MKNIKKLKMKNIKNSFIAFALCMVGPSYAVDSTKADSTKADKADSTKARRVLRFEYKPKWSFLPISLSPTEASEKLGENAYKLLIASLRKDKKIGDAKLDILCGTYSLSKTGSCLSNLEYPAVQVLKGGKVVAAGIKMRDCWVYSCTTDDLHAYFKKENDPLGKNIPCEESPYGESMRYDTINLINVRREEQGIVDLVGKIWACGADPKSANAKLEVSSFRVNKISTGDLDKTVGQSFVKETLVPVLEKGEILSEGTFAQYKTEMGKPKNKDLISFGDWLNARCKIFFEYGDCAFSANQETRPVILVFKNGNVVAASIRMRNEDNGDYWQHDTVVNYKGEEQKREKHNTQEESKE